MALCRAPDRHGHVFWEYIRTLQDQHVVRAQRLVAIEDDPAQSHEQDRLNSELTQIWDHLQDVAQSDDAYARYETLEDWELAEMSASTLLDLQPPDHLDYAAIKARVDLVAYVAQYTKLRKTGQTWKGRCPFPDHDDSTASFHVYAATQTFRCYGCNRGRDLFDFAALMGLGAPHP